MTAKQTPTVAAGNGIQYLGTEVTVALAARELARYLERMTGRRHGARRVRVYDPHSPGIWLGLAPHFGDAIPGHAALHAVAADAVYVSAGNGHAVLAGSNPRSVLFAVYRYLEELGCRWFRPGRDGERVPCVPEPLTVAVDLFEVPSATHRCICIEGSCSIRHVTDMIDYATKRGFNAYFLQFRNAYTFFERWYGVERGRRRRRTAFPSKEATRAWNTVKRAVFRRGLMLHVVGHGWTCEPLGIAGESWERTTQPIPATATQYFAELKGRRELFGGVPLNTQLCYGNPEVRELMVQAVADYAEAHPDEDVIHVWLADGSNNHCECAACRPHRPSDLYVRILNGIDAELTRRKLPHRVVFLAYVDLLWAPRRARIRNPARFILMFAPITRSYSEALADSATADAEAVGPFRRNRLHFSASPATNLRMLRDWSRAFDGESVDFDYHLWRAQHQDVGQMRLARVLQRDIATLRDLGMDGFISCQTQRIAFPTGIYLDLMGRTLWDATSDFDAAVDGYLADLFGNDGADIRAYLERLSRLTATDLSGLHMSQAAAPEKATSSRRWTEASKAATAFRPRIEQGRSSEDTVTAAAWELLDQHAWYVTAFADLYARIERGDESAGTAYSAFARELERRLPAVHHVFDTYLCKGMVQHNMAMRGLPFEECIMLPRT